ncbi:MAG TPA: hypothetical protein VL486_00355, partial [Verrucomicrobiae bacterium]|nr:hypothetical protein [Verrucomicrobiae bacterium]
RSWFQWRILPYDCRHLPWWGPLLALALDCVARGLGCRPTESMLFLPAQPASMTPRVSSGCSSAGPPAQSIAA